MVLIILLINFYLWRAHLICVFHCNVVTSIIFHAKFWGLCYCLKLARQLHIPSILVEVDSVTMVSFVKKLFYVITSLRPLLVVVFCPLHALNWHVSLSQIYSKVYTCVDFLLNLNHGNSFSLNILDISPIP